MRAIVGLDRWPVRDEDVAGTLLQGRPGIARLRSGCAALQTMVDCLEDLASDLDGSRRPDDVRMLMDGLYVALARHLDDEVELLRAVAPGTGELPDEAVEKAWACHVVLRDLAMPVIQELSAIAHDGRTVRTGRFVHIATALCEFIRLHLDHKCKSLYPLLAAFDERRRRDFDAGERLPVALNCWAG